MDYAFEANMSNIAFLQTRNRRKLVAFVMKTPYVRQAGDPADTD